MSLYPIVYHWDIDPWTVLTSPAGLVMVLGIAITTCALALFRLQVAGFAVVPTLQKLSPIGLPFKRINMAAVRTVQAIGFWTAATAIAQMSTDMPWPAAMLWGLVIGVPLWMISDLVSHRQRRKHPH